MHLIYTCALISPEHLKTQNSWEIRPVLPDTFLTRQSIESIRRTGLLYQPIVQKTSDGLYDFITGRRSFEAFQAISPGARIWCRILTDDISARDILCLVFDENSRTRPLSLIELAYFFQLCGSLLSSHEQRELYDSLGLQANPHNINRTIELLQLEPPLQIALLTEKITEVVARELLKLDEVDRTAVFTLFMHLNIGGGKQRRILTLLKDLVGRKGVSVVDYLDMDDIQDILNHQEMNVPQKTQSLLQLLQNLQTPTLKEAETIFSAWKSGLKLPDNCDVEHSPAFEQDSVTLSVTFKNKEQIEKRLAEIKHLVSADIL
jgi:ParB family chromosome partitioning protein